MNTQFNELAKKRKMSTKSIKEKKGKEKKRRGKTAKKEEKEVQILRGRYLFLFYFCTVTQLRKLKYKRLKIYYFIQPN